MVLGIVIGAIVTGIGIAFFAGMMIVAKGCEILNERIAKGD